VAKPIKDPEAKAVEVGHAIGPSQQRPQAIVEAFGWAIAGAGQEIIRNLLLPAVQQVTKLMDGREP
jgi:hypothetical protein